MAKVIIVGGGAAGMMAAIAAARRGHSVMLLEKNEKLGKKIYITGKGRCNLTNGAPVEDFMANVVTNARFLYSSLHGFDNQAVIRLLEEEGIRTKVERGGRVFPQSDKASDVIRGLSGAMSRAGVQVHLNTRVRGLLLEELPDLSRGEGRRGKIVAVNRCLGVVTDDDREYRADVVVVATGGLSYPSTGSTGDGYELARTAGHEITRLRPALVPMDVEEAWPVQLQGLSLRNVRVTVRRGKKQLYEAFGEMLFTHFGVSGPVILGASSYCGGYLPGERLSLTIDLKPALTREQLDARILRDFQENKNKQLINVLGKLYPSKLVPVMAARSQIPPEKRIHDISREERERLVELTKSFPLTLTGLRGYHEAIITQGGVQVKGVNPSSMESKVTLGLRFAGEILDLDALTGGYNLQIAWSTGWAAGSTI